MNRYYIKSKNENEKIFLNERFGVSVIELDDLEEIDKEIEKIAVEKNNIIYISNELASFSNNINKYKNDKNVKIIIS
ncbi:MAG: hypothetical protein HFJ43_01405 [Clostridia bacterium]|nr:hypothetical protein [Clostridia bacterium]